MLIAGWAVGGEVAIVIMILKINSIQNSIDDHATILIGFHLP